MPVAFLTDEQAASYGKFNEEPTRPELARFSYLDDEDRKLIESCNIPVPAQAQEPERPGAVQLYVLHPGRRGAASTA
ncbi:hypothetical protein ABZS83_05480 [Streptomyces sp. NPDC005426]|uniref:hypothetical protein n=1 Tax=Streptomyces sp. NPDC005426 TaxID=3155344 RepID=UPI0033A8343E